MAQSSPKPAPSLASLRIDASKRQAKPLAKWLSILAAVVGLAVIALGAASTLRSRKPEVEVAAALPPSDSTAATALLNASGYVTPQRRATVAAKITGKVKSIYITEGMYVPKDFVLATLDDSDYQVSLASTKADRDATEAQMADLELQLGNDERDLRRTQQLADNKIQTPQALDAAQTLVNRLKAQIAQMRAAIVAADAKMGIDRQNIENCIVRAPFSGIVVSKDAQPGEMVSPISAGGGFTRTGIATIVDMTSNEIEVDVNENYIARVKPGQPVVATLDAYPDWQIPAHVLTIIPTADREKGTVKVRATFDHLDPRILPDMGVKVAFLAQTEAAQPAAGRLGPKGASAVKICALVPAAAVHDTGGQAAVFVFHDGAIERRAIRVGEPRGASLEVLAGLSPGDLVVTKGPEQLRDGQQVIRKQ
jgi:RND family efflux transporter MFP subunit